MAEICKAAERTQSPELLAEQKAVLEEFLETFPSAVSPSMRTPTCKEEVLGSLV